MNSKANNVNKRMYDEIIQFFSIVKCFLYLKLIKMYLICSMLTSIDVYKPFITYTIKSLLHTKTTDIDLKSHYFLQLPLTTKNHLN